jgi:hypothetical protein
MRLCIKKALFLGMRGREGERAAALSAAFEKF